MADELDMSDNPFAALADKDQAPSLYERAGLNANEAFRRGTIAGAGDLAIQRLTAETEGPQQEEALARYEQIVSDLTRYDAMKVYDGPLEGAAALAGQIGGSLLSPESWITGVPGVGAAMEKLGVSGARVLGRVARAGVSQGVINAGTDPVVQALNIGAGQQEQFSPSRMATAFGLGTVIGAGLHGAGEAAGAALTPKAARAVNDANAAEDAGLAAHSDAARAADRERAVLAEQDTSLVSADDLAHGPVSQPAKPSEEMIAGEAAPGQASSAAPVEPSIVLSPEPVAAPKANGTELPPLDQQNVSTAHSAAPVAEASRSSASIGLESIPVYSQGVIEPKDHAPAGVFMFDASNLNTDARRFQYKDNGDTEGVTTALKGITKFDPAKANQIIVWEDSTGKLFVADGHQRTGLARRLVEQGHEQNVKVPGILYREADGFTADNVRAIAAAKNIAEGSGSPIDGAKVLRSHPELLDGSMPMSRTEARQSFELARLDDDAFKMVVNEVVPYQQAAVVGRFIPNDGPRQIAAMKALARFEPRNETEAAVLVQRVAQAEVAKAESGAQGSMFGDLETADSTVGEEMRIVAKAIADLKKDKALFSRVTANADRIEQTGSKIERGTAEAVAQDAEVFARTISSDAYTAGPLRDALKAAAKDLKDGKVSVNDAARGLLDGFRQGTERDVRGGPRDSGRTPEGAGFERTPAGDQGLIPGVEAVTDRQRLELAGNKPLQGGDASAADGGLFDLNARDQSGLMFRKRTGTGKALPGETSAAGAAESRPILSLQEQAAKLADDINLTLRSGRVKGGKDSLGQFDTAQSVARTKNIADVGTVMHEAAHFIEKDGGKAVSDLIRAHKAELGPLDYDAARGDPKEGFAEYLRMTVEAPAAAEKAAPGFGPAFREFLSRENPELLASLDAAKQHYADYISAPSETRIDAIVKTQHPETLMHRLKEDGLPKTVSLMVGRAYEAIFDDKAPVTQAVRDMARMIRDATGQRPNLQGSDNPELLVRMFARAQQAGVRDMLDGVRGYRSIVPEGPSLREALIKATGDPGILGHWNEGRQKAFSNYLVLRRAEKLWDKYDAGDLPNRPLAMTKADVMDALAKADAEAPHLREASDMVHQYTRNLLRKQFNGGLIDRELFDTLMQEGFYVPFFRDMSDKPSGGGSGGGSRSEGPGKANLIKKIGGSDRDIIDPIQSIMTQTFLVNRTLRHNDIMLSLVNLARRAQQAGATGVGRILEEIPPTQVVGSRFDLAETIKSAARQHGVDATDTKVLLGSIGDVFGDDPIMASVFRREPTGKRGEPIVFYKEGGELRAVRLISDKEGRGLYEALTELPPQMNDIALKFIASASQVLRLGITTNWVFALTNFIRDQAAAAILQRGYIPLNPRGIVRELKQDNIAQLYNYGGGVSPGAGSAGLSEMMNGHIDALARKGWAIQKLAGLGDIARKGDVLGGIKSFGEIVEVSESGTRMNVMKQVFDQKKKSGLSDYDAMMEAAYQSTDLMDFGRHGSRIAAMRSLVPFLNATLVGISKAYRTVLHPLVRGATGDIVTEGEAQAVRNAGVALAKLGITGSMGYAYGLIMADHPAYRDANEQLRASHIIVPGDAVGYPGKIVLVPKPFELAILFNLGEMLGMYTKTGDPRTAGFAMAGIQDVLMPPNVLQDIPLLKTWAELKLNRSFFTGRDIVPESMQRLATAEQFTSKTSNLAKTIGGVIGVAPIKVDYAIGNLFGLWGRDLLAASSVTDPNAPSASLEDQMFFRRFIKGADVASETTKRFWAIAAQRNGEYAQAKSTYENMLGQFRDDQAQRFLGALPAQQRAYVTLNSAASDNGKLKFSADEKRLNPVARAALAVQTVNGMIREMTLNAQRSIETGERVDIDPTTRRSIIDNLRQLAAIEQRNALVITQEPGYGDRKTISAESQFKVIEAIDPNVAHELADRYATAKVVPTEAVARAWPEAMKRLLKDGGEADLGDLTYDVMADGYAFGGSRVRKAPKRRLEIPPAEQFTPPPPRVRAPLGIQDQSTQRTPASTPTPAVRPTPAAFRTPEPPRGTPGVAPNPTLP